MPHVLTFLHTFLLVFIRFVYTKFKFLPAKKKMLKNNVVNLLHVMINNTDGSDDVLMLHFEQKSLTFTVDRQLTVIELTQFLPPPECSAVAVEEGAFAV